MPKIPTPRDIPPSTQQIAAVLSSALTASQKLISDNPEAIKDLRPIFLNIYAHPTFSLILGIPTQQPPNHPAIQEQLNVIKTHLQTLSKAVEAKTTPADVDKGLSSPPVAATPAAKNAPPNSYANKAKQESRPSLVLDFLGNPPNQDNRTPGHVLCADINKRLQDSKSHATVRVSAAKWTAKGNVVLTAALAVTQQQLNFASSFIKKRISDALERHDPLTKLSEPLIRATTKWSKALLNGVPTGVSGVRGAYTPEECHLALLADNPQYAQLTITQKPSWVKTPTSYSPSSSSSLVFAFEDPDGSKRANLLNSKHIYLFGTRATIRKWKTVKQPGPPTSNSKPTQSGSTDVHELTPLPMLAPATPVQLTRPPLAPTRITRQMSRKQTLAQ
ncbi:hypothetical protein BC826DRAFT_1061854 [Russula brevipes]|nr:hypothetical protein BC826DRAFT_1061854 [Russula brevipes]